MIVEPASLLPYHGFMKLLCALICAGLSVAAAGLDDVKTVYLMPMSSGLDQHLAVSLTVMGAMQVTTNPLAADAVFTDHIGAAFEQSLTDLYKPEPTASDKKGDEEFPKPAMQPLSRGKGDIFLVDRKTHVVLWSMYAVPKSSQSEDLNELAGKIVAKLQKDRKGK
jgi:hypothetical protein